MLGTKATESRVFGGDSGETLAKETKQGNSKKDIILQSKSRV